MIKYFFKNRTYYIGGGAYLTRWEAFVFSIRLCLDLDVKNYWNR